MRSGRTVLALVVAWCAVADQARGQEQPSRADIERAVSRGLAFLAENQLADGSWKTRIAGQSTTTGAMGLAVMAFLANGHLADGGPYGQCVHRGIENLLAGQKPGGMLGLVEAHEMYDHGLATIALAEAYGTTADAALEANIGRALEQAVKLILASQGADGGWNYRATSRPAHHDLSLSVMQLMALRAARNAGKFVPQSIFDSGVRYVEGCYDASQGGFAYQPGGGSRYPMTAAGVVSLQVCGRFARDDPRLLRGLGYLERNAIGPQEHYYYAVYYTAQAAFQAGGEHWRTLQPRIATSLLSRQKSDGSWEKYPVFGTAVAVIALSADKRYLPIYVEEERAK